MMAGYKTWADTDVLYAADLNEFLMGQAVPRFASSAARTAAMTPATGQLSYVTGTGLTMYNGTAWVAVHTGQPVAVTGSRGANAALASLLTQLAALGIIIDNTTA